MSTANLGLLTFRVYYPTGASPRIIHALSIDDARRRATLRWREAPTRIEQKEEA